MAAKKKVIGGYVEVSGRKVPFEVDTTSKRTAYNTMKHKYPAGTVHILKRYKAPKSR